MAQLATLGVEFALTGRLVKDANQISARAKEFGRLFVQETRIAVATAAMGIDVSTLNPLNKTVGGAVEQVKATGAAQKAIRVYTETEIAVAKQINAAAGNLVPELIKFRTARAG